MEEITESYDSLQVMNVIENEVMNATDRMPYTTQPMVVLDSTSTMLWL